MKLTSDYLIASILDAGHTHADAKDYHAAARAYHDAERWLARNNMPHRAADARAFMIDAQDRARATA